MTKRGRPPTPTKLRLVRESATGHREPGINRDEPKPKDVKRIPPVPASIKGDKIGEKAWRHLARRLIDMHVLGDVDVYALEQFASWYSRWHYANEQCRTLGDIITTKDGNLIQNPYLSVARRASEAMNRYMGQLGITPAARSQVTKLPGAGDDLLD